MKKLETERLYLRDFKSNDYKQVFKYLTGNKKIAQEGNFKVHNNVYETKEVIYSFIVENKNETVTFAIEEKSSEKIIGYMQAYDISIDNKSCKITGILGFPWRNKGYTQEALKIFINYLHSQKKLNVVENTYYGYNPIISYVLEKVGMTKEAVLKNRKFNKLTGLCEDLIIYSSIK